MLRGQPSNFRGRGGGGSRGGGRNTKQRTQPRGLFADGIWHCDCNPRLPAEHFKVKKEGKNQGRWFYTCQQQDPKRCGFFLWDEEAKPREEAAVLSGKRNEPGLQEGWNAGRRRQEESSANGPRGKGLFERKERAISEDDSTQSESPSPVNPIQPSHTNGAKRSASAARLDDDDFEAWSLDEEDEEALANAADAVAPLTPHKAQKTGVYATPATTAKRKLPWLEQPPDTTPVKIAEDYFSTPSKQPTYPAQQTQSTVTEPETPGAPPTLATASTPSPPTRYKDALFNPADDASSLTAEVLASLSSAPIPAEMLSHIRGILTKHDLKTQGIKKGRDISRLALKAKDAKIAELQARIASLEAEKELERGLGRMRRGEGG